MAWLARRIGMGLPDGLLDDPDVPAAQALVDAWLDPDAANIPAAPSPFAEVAPTFIPAKPVQAGEAFVERWLDHLHETPRPLEAFMTMFWHDHFAVSYAEVNQLGLIAQHLETIRRHALGNFRELLYAVAVDPAMLEFLDGKTSNLVIPNENFGRELMELYSLGLGVFTERDVQEAAAAATGWQITQATGQSRFEPSRHDDAPRTVVGVVGVHDMETLIGAVTGHAACAPMIVGKLCTWILGAVPEDDVLADLATTFSADLEIRPVLRRILALGLAGPITTQPLHPVFWMTASRKATGARPEPGLAVPLLRSAGMVPAFPPNVGGFPPAAAYLSASSVVARFSAASAIVDATPGDSVALRRARELDLDGLARHLGLVDGFIPATRTAIEAAHRESPAASGRAALTLALAAPEVAVL